MFKNKFSLFLYASTTGVFINLVGRLMLAEIVALVSFPFINFRKLLRENKELNMVSRGLLILLAAQIVSDIINQSAPKDYLRGWSAIIFSMISVIYLVKHLGKNPENIVYYLFAIFITSLIFGSGELDFSITETNTNYFKTRFVGFLNPALMLFAYHLYKKRRSKLTSLLLLIYGLFCMIMDARSNGLIYIISGLLIYIKASQIKLSKSRLFFSGIFISAILYFGYVFYVNQVLDHGLGGTNAKSQLNMASNPYNPLELLYYGRSDFIFLFYASMDKPIFGHGSWGKDETGKYAQLLAKITNTESFDQPGYFSAHSVFFGTWAYAGIVGFIAAFVVFFKLFKKMFIFYKSNVFINTFPILIVLTMDMLWAYFFSPIGVLRTTFPIFAALIIIEYNRFINISSSLSNKLEQNNK